MPKFDDQGRWVEPETDQQWYRAGRRWVILGIVVLLLLPVVGFGIKWVTADARGAGAAREQIKANGALRIAAYNHFFDLCSSVQAQEDRIRIFSDDTSPEGQTNLRAVEATRAELVRRYNTDAAKSYTEGQFRSSHLPYALPTDPTQETQCNT